MSEVWGKIEQAGLTTARHLADLPRKTIRKHLFSRLILLSSRKLCAQNAPWWVTNSNGSAFAVTLSENADGRLGGHPCVVLKGLELLEDGAQLTFHVHVDPAAKPPAQYSTALVGRTRATGEDWFARVDLSGTRQGLGLCSHPLLHAHIGTNPDATFQPRVPLYPLLPWEAVDWLLTTADAACEPCPHG